MQLARFGRSSYAELASLVKTEHIKTYDLPTADGIGCHIEVQFVWDFRPAGVIRILGSIYGNDSFLRAFVPFTRSLLVLKA